MFFLNEDTAERARQVFQTLVEVEYEALGGAINNEAQEDEEEPQNPVAVIKTQLRSFVNSLVVTVWLENGTKNWYVGYITDVGDDDTPTIEVDHLHRTSPPDNKTWAYPRKPDKCPVQFTQFLSLEPKTEWNIAGRIYKLTVMNHREIQTAVNSKEV